MARRITRNTTNIKGEVKVEATAVWRVFECFQPGCDQIIKVSEDEFSKTFVNETFEVVCPKCGYPNPKDVVLRASRWKYCRVCSWLQPIENFHNHKPNPSSFRSGKQLECKVCKNTKINPALNPQRTADQLRESSQRRRLYNVISGETGKIDSKAIFAKFEGKCFKCGKGLHFDETGVDGYHLDHTLPARYLWPLTTGNATLLCSLHNNHKHDKWPSEFYSQQALKKLAVLTGYPLDLLSGKPCLNPQAVESILVNVDEFITTWIGYPEDIKKVRNLIKDMEGKDIFDYASNVPTFLIED